MPYQGDIQGPPTFAIDIGYIKKLPGILIVIQLVCCALGFFLSLGASFVWRRTAGQTFFTFIVFVASLGCLVWLVVHVLKLNVVLHRNVNWNVMGIVHNGVFAFFVMVASCVMIEVASAARPLRAAGVFGFLGFTGFLVALAWEVMLWLKNRDPGLGYATATVVEGPKRPESLQDGEVNLRDEIASYDDPNRDASVGFVGMKARPVSSFYQEANQNGEVTTPMLYAPGNEDVDKEGPKKPPRASAISEKSEDSSNASSVQGEWQTPQS